MILFTADIHLKLGQKNVPVEWAKNRYRKFFKEVQNLEKTVSKHIIGGDLFDRLPSMEELELYFEWVGMMKVPTIIATGNHEATKKGKSFLTQLKSVTQSINPLVSIVDENYICPELGYGILPYENLHKKNCVDFFNKDKPLFTHVRGEIPPHVKPEVDLDISDISDIEERSFTDFVSAFIDCIDVPSPVPRGQQELQLRSWQEANRARIP